jgi:hypothetical protein
MFFLDPGRRLEDARQDPGNTGGRDQPHSVMGSPMQGVSHSPGPAQDLGTHHSVRSGREGDSQVINILLTLVTYKVAWDLHDKVNTKEDGLHMVSQSIKTGFSRTYTVLRIP